MPDSYLVITGIPGDSTAEGHTNQIELHSHAFGITTHHAPTTAGGGAGASKPAFSDVIVTKSIDSSTIPLVKAALQGKILSTVTLYVMQETEVDGQPQTLGPLETVTMTGAYVTKYTQSTLDDEGDPIETITFDFTRVKYTVDGQSFTWDLKTNKGS